MPRAGPRHRSGHIGGPGLNTPRGARRILPRFGPFTPESVGLVVIALALTASLVLDAFGPVLGGMAGLCVLFLTLGSPLRTILLSLGLMVAFTVGELSAVSLGVSFIAFRVDEIVLVWFVLLWLVAVADGKAGPAPRGILPALIILFTIDSAFGAFRGVAAGSEGGDIWSLRTFFGYAAFFPLCWVASDPGDRDRMMKALFACAALAGVILFMKGLLGVGEGVYYMTLSGLRIGSRQPNAIAALMLMLVARIWKAPVKPPLALAVPALVAMAVAIILSQTRALWGGIMLALASAWLLDLFRKEEGPGKGRRLVLSLTLIAVLTILAVIAVSALGLLSTAEMAARVEGDQQTYPIDPSLLSRLLSWAAILSVLGGPGLLLGNGLGATIIYYKPEYEELRRMFFVDGAFWQTLLDLGLVGVVLLASMWIFAIVSSAKLYLKTRDRTRAATALGLFCAFLVLMVAAQLSSVITNYNYTVLWALFMAFLHLEWRAERSLSAADR